MMSVYAKRGGMSITTVFRDHLFKNCYVFLLKYVVISVTSKYVRVF